MKSFVIFALIPLILSIGIISVTPLVDALQEKDVDTECREGQVLVFRINSNNYVCVSESTAQKWIDWGIAEQVEQAEEPAMAEEVMQTDSDLEPRCAWHLVMKIWFTAKEDQ